VGQCQVLKLYDRRFAKQLREGHYASPWNQELASEYQKFVIDGRASESLKNCRERSREDNSWEYDLEKPDDSSITRTERETYLQSECFRIQNAELTAHGELREMQGKDIPRMLHRISLRTQPGPDLKDEEYFDVHGILLEYISGFPLHDLAEYVLVGDC
jgi:hypothetical protein